MNKITRNQEQGIRSYTKNELRSDCIIKFNWIEKNLEDGIIIEGKENFTRVDKNHHISNNRKAGVRVVDNA